MAESSVRVALLARAGKARDQLHRALGEAGANIVAEGDPADLDPGQVAGQMPTIYLVSLEPAIEAGLDRFDELLAAAGIEVMFDDAEVTARLDGWDLNRWARHVAHKLLGSDGLPAAPADSTRWDPNNESLEPGAPLTPAQVMDAASFEDYTADAEDLADSVPISESLLDRHQDSGLDLDLTDLDLDSSSESFFPPGDDISVEVVLADPGVKASVNYSRLGHEEAEDELGDLNADVAELAAQLNAFDKSRQATDASEEDFSIADLSMDPVDGDIELIEAFSVADSGAGVEMAVEVIEMQEVEQPASFDFSNLALAPMEGQPELAATTDLAVEGIPGAVVILAGLGGPDAVRQLLSSLPETLKVPVLLYQHLEVGKHERLVEQLAKISKLPVVLAIEGDTPLPGKVTLLPSGLSARASGASLVFTTGALAELIEAVPAQESMIIVLSGADAQLVPMILVVRDAGGLVLAQDPEVCFDGAAAEAMQQQGAAVYPALGLARQIAARWLT